MRKQAPLARSLWGLLSCACSATPLHARHHACGQVAPAHTGKYAQRVYVLREWGIRRGISGGTPTGAPANYARLGRSIPWSEAHAHRQHQLWLLLFLLPLVQLPMLQLALVGVLLLLVLLLELAAVVLLPVLLLVLA